MTESILEMIYVAFNYDFVLQHKIHIYITYTLAYLMEIMKMHTN